MNVTHDDRALLDYLRDLSPRALDILRKKTKSTERLHASTDDTGKVITSDEWCTPPSISIPLFNFWGVADGDPCSNDRSIVKAKERYEWGGLVRPWWEDTYANWPYSQNEPWSRKAIYEMKIKNVRELVILCMTATSTIWWRNLMITPKRNPRVILVKRQKFLGPDGKAVDSSRFEPALIYYGSRAKAFDKEFRHEAMWSTWGR